MFALLVIQGFHYNLARTHVILEIHVQQIIHIVQILILAYTCVNLNALPAM